jgi:iron-sulfur cluster assembly accessory protein
MDLTLTRAAARFMRMSLMSDGSDGSGFRMRVSPGGCAGLTADVSVAPALADGERALVVDGIRLFLDAQSRLLLQGVTIDFVDSMSSQGLVFHDPKHVATCSTTAAPAVAD